MINEHPSLGFGIVLFIDKFIRYKNNWQVYY